MSTELALRTSAPDTWGFMGRDMDAAGKLAKALVATGLAPQGMTPAAAFYVLLAGAELGLRGPVEALRHVIVVKGKVAISAELMRAKMLEAGCKIEWLKSDDKGATIKITRPDKTVGTFSFTEDDARRAGLLGNNTWKNYPTSMYQARVTSLAARAFCPDMLRGASYTPDELGARPVVSPEGEVEYRISDADIAGDDDDPEPNGNGHRAELPPATDYGDPGPSAEPERISSAQVKALAILATRKLGNMDRASRLAWIGEAIGREIETSADLTPSEWHRVVDNLNQQKDRPKGRGTETTEGEGTPVSGAEPGEEGAGVEGTPSSEPGDLPFENEPSTAERVRELAEALGLWRQGRGVELNAAQAKRIDLDAGVYVLPDLVAMNRLERLLLLLTQAKAQKDRKAVAA